MIKRNEASHINITLAAMIPTPAVATFTILAGTAADVAIKEEKELRISKLIQLSRCAGFKQA
jgi:hypothetical protein